MESLNINRQFRSPHCQSRAAKQPKILVLHYTEVPLNTTLAIFTNNPTLSKQDALHFLNTQVNLEDLFHQTVSAHYVISESGEVYEIVPEALMAYHAGASYWHGYRNINDISIGIEHVNLGFNWSNAFPHERGMRVPGSNKIWCAFAPAQIDKTIQLCRRIVQTHRIQPYDIVGHSDIACNRKSDPGPLFPWKILADAGIGLWYDVAESAFHPTHLPADQVAWFRQKLAEFGYDCPTEGPLDETLNAVIKAFQMHFRPAQLDGKIDLECIQILDSLCLRKQRCQ